MKNLTPTQKRSLTAAIALVAGLVLASFLGAKPFLSDLFSEKTLTANHEVAPPEPEDTSQGTAETGLRHAVGLHVQPVQVLNIIDGDTLEVSLNGAREVVRLIGINTPESAHEDESKNTPEGILAAEHMAKLVNPGDIVYLQKDVTDKDTHNRMLRYVWLERPTSFNGKVDVGMDMLNGRMLADGYAVAHKFKPDDAYFEIFKSLQLDALHEERGLWENGVSWSQGL